DPRPAMDRISAPLAPPFRSAGIFDCCRHAAPAPRTVPASPTGLTPSWRHRQLWSARPSTQHRVCNVTPMRERVRAIALATSAIGEKNPHDLRRKGSVVKDLGQVVDEMGEGEASDLL